MYFFYRTNTVTNNELRKLVYGQWKIPSIEKSITNDVYPIDLFKKHINSSIYIQIIQRQHDTNNYIVTLYSNNFYINLDRNTNIHNDNNMD